MRLRVREILPAIISLRQFHPDVGEEWRRRVFPEKILGRRNDFRWIGIGKGIFNPNRQIIGALGRGGVGSAGSRAFKILPRLIEARWGSVKRQLGQRHPGFGRTPVAWEFAQKTFDRLGSITVSVRGLGQTLLEEEIAPRRVARRAVRQLFRVREETILIVLLDPRSGGVNNRFAPRGGGFVAAWSKGCPRFS